MNTLSKHVSFLLSLTAITFVSSALSAQAQMTEAVPALSSQSSESAPAASESDTSSKPVARAATIAPISQPTVPARTEDNQGQVAQAVEYPAATQQQETQATPTAETPVASETAPAQPVPGTTMTSAEGLATEPSKVAQTEIAPGRPTRSGRSYVGVGANIGFGGDTALGRGNFAILSKIGLTNTLSVRPSAILGSDTVILLPVTYDFSLRQTDPFEPVTFAPYIGGGATYSTDKGKFGFLVSGGVDFPFSPQFTATAGLNVSFKDETEVGLLLGVGYTFSGF